MSLSKLQGELEKVGPAATEAAGAVALANAYAVYAADAVVALPTPVPLSSLGLAAGKSAMSSALIGMNASGAAVGVITSALVAFWGAVAATPAVSFSGATAVLPPPHASFSSDLTSTATSNVQDENDLATAMHAIASDMHKGATTGGTATIAMVPTAIK
jgi:hypothetical protein